MNVAAKPQSAPPRSLQSTPFAGASWPGVERLSKQA